MVGRQDETREINTTLHVIEGAAGKMNYSPDAGIVIVGVRGMGRTSLLKHAAVSALKRGIAVAEVDGSKHPMPQKGFASSLFLDKKPRLVTCQDNRLRLGFHGPGVFSETSLPMSTLIRP